ncbi:uncharacterized protein LOC112567187 isoform X2 [Pomacea canaliculata]|uniref:uncharacterized protein LOC112567187 isoform X2 n=1 Tax=Pomacea canaliculata TaxID=400727 RepID=UPI000D727302|nr:uncharacterized protein LOC112567187 isoform X2 [Pomacea canaliculata]
MTDVFCCIVTRLVTGLISILCSKVQQYISLLVCRRTRWLHCSALFSCSLLALASERSGAVEITVASPHCDPRVDRRFEGCPEGYCCVRDEYVPSFVYCKRLGHVDDNCTTRDSESGCPCLAGLTCHPNAQSATFVSMYGRCHNTTDVVHSV